MALCEKPTGAQPSHPRRRRVRPNCSVEINEVEAAAERRKREHFLGWHDPGTQVSVWNNG